MELPQIVQHALRGDTRWLARVITLIEMRDPVVGASLGAIPKGRDSAPGKPQVLGITGPPGAGKSSLVEQLVGLYRAAGNTVAVVAVDPSSPFSGGAILGDRIRMETHTMDPGVYMRSVSSRGHLGGLSAATTEVVSLLDAAGFDTIIVETVGVGQSELGVMEVADTVVVVVTPDSGDSIQAMKAGLFEVADVFFVNKSDRPGADRIARDLQQAIDLVRGESWSVPVHQGSAERRQGLVELKDACSAHVRWCQGDGIVQWRQRRGNARMRLFTDLVAERTRFRLLDALDDAVEQAIRDGSLSPYDAMGRSD